MSKANKAKVEGGGPSRNAGGRPRKRPADPPPEEPPLMAHGDAAGSFGAPADDPPPSAPEPPSAPTPAAEPVSMDSPPWEPTPSEPPPGGWCYVLPADPNWRSPSGLVRPKFLHPRQAKQKARIMREYNNAACSCAEAAPRLATLVLWSIPCFVGCTGATPTRLGAAMVAWLRWGQLETWSGNGTATASITPSRLAFPSSQTEFATSDAMCVVGVATLAGRSARVGARWCARVVMPRAARMCPYAHLGGMQGQACAGVTCTRPSDGCGTHGQRIRGMSSGVSRRCSHAKCENLKPLNPVVQLVNDVTGCSKVFPHA